MRNKFPSLRTAAEKMATDDAGETSDCEADDVSTINKSDG